jgi:hypothetical protein
LFALEQEYAKLSPDGNFSARRLARAERSKPVMDAFFSWAKVLEPSVFPKSLLGVAIQYALNQRQWLERVLLDGRLELSNNRAERSIKPFVIGRKNWMFNNTPKGAKASAMIYSIVETAKENAVNPFDYLSAVFHFAPISPITLPLTLYCLGVVSPFDAYGSEQVPTFLTDTLEFTHSQFFKSHWCYSTNFPRLRTGILLFDGYATFIAFSHDISSILLITHS